MKTFLIAAAAIASLGAALPASAQTWDHGHALQTQGGFHRVDDRFEHDGGRFLSPWEARRLEQRRLEERRQFERHAHHTFSREGSSHEGFRDGGRGYAR